MLALAVAILNLILNLAVILNRESNYGKIDSNLDSIHYGF